jgi:hypothetical protein
MMKSKIAFPNQAWVVITILVISLLLRWTLVIKGGQFYFSDEHRYETSQEVAGLLLQGKGSEAVSHLFVAPEHLGFKIMGILPALVEHLVRPSLVIPALFFSLFSVLNIYLIFLLSQRMGATWNESLLALVIAASSQSLLYYSRHLMPYDPAMTFGLLSLYVALKKEASIKTSLSCGAFGFFCFITYNGYWILAGFAMLSHLFAGDKRLLSFLRRGVLLAAGFVIPLVVTMLLANWAGINLLLEYTQFANTVTQGDYSEGWSLPFEYFWHTEHFMILILGLLSTYAIFLMIERKENSGIWWIAGIVFVYGCSSIFSVYFQSFVVYGRLARQMMPFLILLAAIGLVHLSDNRTPMRPVANMVMALIVVQGLWNYSYSFGLSYPREFSTKAQITYMEFNFSPKRMAFGAPTLCQNNGYVMENAKYFLEAPQNDADIKGTILLSHPHPINFWPYQYEGYPPEQRQQFRNADLWMVFYKVDDDFMSESNPVWADIKSCVVKEDH